MLIRDGGICDRAQNCQKTGVARRNQNMINKIPKQFRPVLTGLIFGTVGVTILYAARAASNAVSPEAEAGSLSSKVSLVTDSTASSSQAVKFGSNSSCTPTVNTILVPSCGVWLGGFANDHPPASTFRERIEDHEARITRQLSFVHSYHQPTDTGLSNDDKYFINRANTYLLTNWKPASVWADGAGSNATVNSRIDSWANSIKSVAPKKVMLIIAHEPENDVSGGGTGCSVSYVGNSGTPTEYRAMWQNVRNRFDAAGVNNAVWAINYMSATKWICLRDDLWPGNNLVDWVLFNQYPGDGDTWSGAMGQMYNWLMSNSDATHNFASKPFGVGEWGSWMTNSTQTYKLYDDAAAAIANGDLANIKLYTAFDAIGVNNSRIDYDDASQPDPTELQHYIDFANSAGVIKQ